MRTEQSRFIAMMNNYERTLELSEIAQDASGASAVQFSDTLDSVQAKLNQIQSNFERLMGYLIDNRFVKGILDLVNKGLTYIGNMAKEGLGSFGVFVTIIWMNVRTLLGMLVNAAASAATAAIAKIATIGKKLDDVTASPHVVKITADTTVIRNELTELENRLASIQVGKIYRPIVASTPTSSSTEPGIPQSNSTPVVAGGSTPLPSSAIPGLSRIFSIAAIQGLTMAFATKNVALGLSTFIGNTLINVLSNDAIRTAVFEKIMATGMATGIKSAFNMVLPALGSAVPYLIIPAIVAGLILWFKDFDKRTLARYDQQISESETNTQKSQAEFLDEQTTLKSFAKTFAEYEKLQAITSKTAEETAKFADITKELIEVSNNLGMDFPQIIKGYDEEGQVIFETNDKIREAIDQQTKLTAEKQRAYALDTLRTVQLKVEKALAEQEMARVKASTRDTVEFNRAYEESSTKVTKALYEQRVATRALAAANLTAYGASIGKTFTGLSQEIGTAAISERSEQYKKENPNYTEEDLQAYMEQQAKIVGDMVNWTQIQTEKYNKIASNMGKMDLDALKQVLTASGMSTDLQEEFVKKYKAMFDHVNDMIANGELKIDLTKTLYYDRDDLVAFFAKYGDEAGKELLEGKHTENFTEDQKGVIVKEDFSNVEGVRKAIGSFMDTGMSAEKATEAALSINSYVSALKGVSPITKQAIKDFSSLGKTLQKKSGMEQYSDKLTALSKGILLFTDADLEELAKSVPITTGIFNDLSEGLITTEQAYNLLHNAISKVDYEIIYEDVKKAIDGYTEAGEITAEVAKSLGALGISEEVFLQDLGSANSLLKAFLTGSKETFLQVANSAFTLNGVDFTKLINGGEMIAEEFNSASTEVKTLFSLLAKLSGIKLTPIYAQADTGYGDMYDVLKGYKIEGLEDFNPRVPYNANADKGNKDKTKAELLADKYYYIEKQLESLNKTYKEGQDVLKSYHKEEQRTGVYDPKEYEKRLGAISDSLEKEKELNEIYGARIKQDKESFKNELASSAYSQYLSVDDNGILKYSELMLTTTVYTKEADAALQDYIERWENLTEKGDNYTDTQKEIVEQQEELIQTAREYFKELQDSYVDLQSQILDAIKARDQEEVDLKEESYNRMKELDDRYLSELKKNISKRRSERDKELQYEDLNKLEARLALLKRDTSKAHAMEILEIEEELKDARREMADKEVDDEIALMEESIEKRDTKNSDEIKMLREALKIKEKDVANYTKEITSLLAGSESSLIAFLQQYDSSYKNAPTEQRKIWLEELRKDMNMAAVYTDQVLGSFNVNAPDSQWSGTKEQSHDKAEAARAKLSAAGYSQGAADISSWDYNGALTWFNTYVKNRTDLTDEIKKLFWEIVLAKKSWHGYSDGGLVDYTGLAMVHGSKSKPEAFLNAEDTQAFNFLLQSLRKLTTIPTMNNATTVAGAGDITIYVTVDEIANDYDVSRAVEEMKKLIVSSSKNRSANIINKKR